MPNSEIVMHTCSFIANDVFRHCLHAMSFYYRNPIVVAMGCWHAVSTQCSPYKQIPCLSCAPTRWTDQQFGSGSMHIMREMHHVLLRTS